MKKIIAEFVNARQIQGLFCESGFTISYNRAKDIKKELKDEHNDVALPDKRVIPVAWVYEKYGVEAYCDKEKKPSIEE